MRMFKSVIIGMLVLIVPVCALQWGYYLKFRSNMIKREVSSMETIADMQKERMGNFIAYNLDRLDLVTSRRIFRDLLKDFLKKRDKDTQYQLNRSLADTRRAIPVFDVLSVADLTGHVVTSTDNVLIGTDVSSMDLFREGRKQNAIALAFPEDGSTDEPYIQLAGPMVIDDQVSAVAIIKVHPTELLTLLRGTEGVAEGYWTLVQRVDAVRAALITPAPNGTTLVRRIVPSDSEPHLQEALLGADITVFDQQAPAHTHVTRFIPDVGWALISSRSASAVMLAIDDFRNSLALLVLLLSAYVVGVSLYLNRVASSLSERHLRPSGASQDHSPRT